MPEPRQHFFIFLFFTLLSRLPRRSLSEGGKKKHVFIKTRKRVSTLFLKIF